MGRGIVGMGWNLTYTPILSIYRLPYFLNKLNPTNTQQKTKKTPLTSNSNSLQCETYFSYKWETRECIQTSLQATPN